MPNPRYLTEKGKATVELLQKLTKAKQVYFNNLEWFCNDWGYSLKEFNEVEKIYLIGSHAEESSWKDETSDLDLKLIVPNAMASDLWNYKRRVLNPLLCVGEKKRWIDLFFANAEYQVTDPKWDLTNCWNSLSLK